MTDRHHVNSDTPVNQEFEVLKLEKLTVQSTGQAAHTVLARLPNQTFAQYRFMLPPALDLCFQHASPEKPMTAVFTGVWRTRPHNGGNVLVFNAKSCHSIEGRPVSGADTTTVLQQTTAPHKSAAKNSEIAL